MSRLPTKLALTAASLFIILLTTEGMLRLYSAHSPYVLMPPGTEKMFHFDPAYVQGFDGTNYFRINHHGWRGPDIGNPDDELLIAAIGGSTTECAYLDETETWPHLVQQELNRQGSTVNMANLGRSGHATPGHLYLANYFVPQHPFDAALILTGINDLSPILERGDFYQPEAGKPYPLNAAFRTTFWKAPPYQPDSQRPFPFNLAVFNTYASWAHARNLMKSFSGDPYLDIQNGKYIADRAAKRNSADTILTSLPDLQPALEQYADNLRAIIKAFRNQGLPVYFCTQPHRYHPGMPAEEARLFIGLGYSGNADREDVQAKYTPALQAQGLRAFNETLVTVCREEGVPCLDLAEKLYGREGLYYDEMHFTEKGAQAVAREIAAFLAPLVKSL